jgi:aspartyl-tRNA(Asn)/glutamyl-tRNA(Gln) amidotransferase subunit A
VRLGVPRAYFYDTLEPDVGAAVETALGVLRDLGASVQEVRFPSAVMASTLYPFASRPEAAVYQEAFLQQPDDYGADVRPTAEMGAVILATDYLRAQRFRTAIRKELEGLLVDVDALITPTAWATPHPIGRRWTEINGQPVNPTLVATGNTSPFSMTGTPALSVCCGFSADGLPIGMQIAGRAWDEPTTLRIGAAYERATPWHQRHPTL